VKIYHASAIAGPPQDLKFAGEKTELIVGDNTVIREFVTLNRGTAAHGRTEIGKNCLMMAYSHAAHDCIIGDNVIIANSVQMGGHVEIGDFAIIGGATVIHSPALPGIEFNRFTEARVFARGYCRVKKDVSFADVQKTEYQSGPGKDR
jgi:acyl-ACP--UDP-N-acetylglucosamine O-acyltransferase